MNGFDPDAFLGGGAAPAQAPATGAPGGFDPDAFLGPPPEPVAPSKTESFFRAAGQAASFGLGDELVGGVESLFTSKSYQEARDESRAANEAARAANPGTYLAGEVAGSLATAFVPGAGIARGATLAAKVGKAAVGGAAAGFGYSDANTAEGVIKDTAAGAALGAAGGAVFAGVEKGLAKIAASSPQRAAKRVVQEIVSSANPQGRNKLLGESGKNTQRIGEIVLKDAEMLKHYRDPVKLQSVVKDRLAKEAERLTPIYESVDQVARGVDVDDVRKVIDSAAQKHRSKFRGSLADMLQKKADEFTSVTADAPRTFMAGAEGVAQTRHMTAMQMRDLVSSFQDDAFAGSFINPTAAKKAMREVSAELREVLNKHVETVGGRANIADSTQIRSINGRIADLINLKDVTERAATRAQGATKVAPFSLKNAEMLATNPLALIAGAYASPQLAGAAIAGKAALYGARQADNALAASILKGGKAPTIPGALATQRATTNQGTATVARGRSTLADLAAMAQQGVPADEIQAAAKAAGIAPSAVKRLIVAFGG